MIYKFKRTKVSVVAINDNHTLLEAMRNRHVRTWANALAHQIEKQRFLNAWGQIGQQHPTIKGV
jgi:hypothetical protein